MVTRRPSCPCCERHEDLLECGLCNDCSASEPLRRAFGEGQANRAAREAAEAFKP